MNADLVGEGSSPGQPQAVLGGEVGAPDDSDACLKGGWGRVLQLGTGGSGASLLERINAVGKSFLTFLDAWTCVVVFLQMLVVFMCCWAQMGNIDHLQH